MKRFSKPKYTDKKGIHTQSNSLDPSKEKQNNNYFGAF